MKSIDITGFTGGGQPLYKSCIQFSVESFLSKIIKKIRANRHGDFCTGEC